MTRLEKQQDLESVGIKFVKRERGNGLSAVWEAWLSDSVIASDKMLANCIDEAYERLGG